MKEIKYPPITLEDFGYKITENECPNCKGRLIYGPAPCPAGKTGCRVLHFGYRCFNCNKYFI